VLSIRGIPRTFVVADLVAAAFAGLAGAAYWPVSVVWVSPAAEMAGKRASPSPGNHA
jgi:hypothetical protein